MAELLLPWQQGELIFSCSKRLCRTRSSPGITLATGFATHTQFLAWGRIRLYAVSGKANFTFI
jgi:hypothetical protein